MITLIALLVSQFTLAAEYKSHIINLLADDEGMKVIVNDNASSDIASLYLLKSSDDFLTLSQKLQDIQKEKGIAVITVKSNELAEIVDVKQEK